MAQISILNLTFCHDGDTQNLFENLNLELDTTWRLGLIGRNGRGKTTLLHLLEGRYPYRGSIVSPVSFDYFPYDIPNPERPALAVLRQAIAPFDQWEEEMQRCAADPALLEQYGQVLEQYTAHDGFVIDNLIAREAGKLEIPEEALHRPFNTLSGGERTRLMLAALFLKHGNFLLIDEPTNHLDADGRRVVGNYLATKQGFIMVSHDRDRLDQVADHILCITATGVELQQGNYSSWEENTRRQEQFELAENKRLEKDIARLKQAAAQRAEWSHRTEASKIGAFDKGFVGHKAAKMMKRAKSIQQRQEQAIAEKTALLKNLETAEALKIQTLPHPKELLVEAEKLTISYDGRQLFAPVSFQLRQGERVALCGPNGSGKTSLLKLILGENIPHSGRLTVAGGLVVSYLPQDSSFLAGGLTDFAAAQGLEVSLFLAILRKLGFARSLFELDMAGYSAGQKKKVLLAACLARPAHLYLWDEPLNFIDLLSRVQVEELLMEHQPTILFVEHDTRFTRRIATKRVELTTPL